MNYPFASRGGMSVGFAIMMFKLKFLNSYRYCLSIPGEKASLRLPNRAIAETIGVHQLRLP